MPRPKLTFANVIALIALFISLGGTVYAAAKINGKTIRKESIPANRVKADGLTGAQIDESSLGVVPSAARAQEATKATEAQRAASAQRADTAARADLVTEAGRAGLVLESDHAKKADLADVALATQTLEGLAPSAFRPGGCDGTGTIKAFVTFAPRVGGTHKLSEHNCSGGEVNVDDSLGNGFYRVTFTGLRNARFALASTTTQKSSASANLMAPNSETWEVVVFSTEAGRLPEEQFSLVVF